MSDIDTQTKVFVLGDSNTAQMIEMLTARAAEHGAEIIQTFAFPVGEPAEHADLTNIDAVVDAVGIAIATGVPLWLPFWHQDFAREEHLRRLSLTLQRHDVDLLIGPNLMRCPREGGVNEVDAALRNEVRLVYALDDAAIAAGGMRVMGPEIEAELAWVDRHARQNTSEERLFRTPEAAYLLGTSRGRLKKGLREGVFCDLDGTVVEPLRTGKGGHRHYTVDMLRVMAASLFRLDELNYLQLSGVTAELDRLQRY